MPSNESPSTLIQFTNQRFQYFRSLTAQGPVLTEAVLVLLCCLVLWGFAQPLATERNLQPDAEHQVEGHAPPLEIASLTKLQPTFLTELRELQQVASISERAQALSRHAGLVLVFVGVGGWIALWIGRSTQPLAVRLSVLLTYWPMLMYMVAGWVGRNGLEPSFLPSIWICMSMFGGISTLTTWYLARANRQNQTQPKADKQPVPWVYPGWLLFSGIGCLWLMDYAAHGYPKHRYSGIYQFDAWLLATAALTVCAAVVPHALAGLSHLFARFEGGKWNGFPAIFSLLVAWLSMVAALSYFFDPRQQYVAATTEALRLPVWVVLAWVAYRWIESGLRPLTGLLMAASMLLALILALLVVRDRGPILAQAVAIAIVLGGLVIATFKGRRLLPLALGIGVTLTSFCLLAIGWVLFNFAPVDRLAVLTTPHRGQLEFLSEISWFLHATPIAGYGLGHVPWCGYAASLGAATCTGVPQQIQSDYVLAALIGVWGPFGGLLLLSLLLLWLGAMVAGRGKRASGKACDLQVLSGWLIASIATTYAAQTVISSMGTLGLIPLTGISIPAYAFGGTSLLTVGLLGGLAVNIQANNLNSN